MASQSGYFSLQELSDGGVLLVGGRLYTYAQGTTTFKTAYTDAAGSVPQTYTSDGIGGQYIALNARGELPAPLYLTTGSYDIALKRADGSTVWTRRADLVDDTANALNTALVTSLANGGATLQGVGQIGVGTTTSYNQGTAGARFQDDLIRVINYLTETSRTQVKSAGTTVDLTSQIANLQAVIANRPMAFNAGIWSIVTLSLIGYYGGIFGEGSASVTLFRARTAGNTLINAADTTDANAESPLRLSDVVLDGNSLATTTGISARYRHHSDIRNVFIANCTTGIYEIDTYVSRSSNVRISACTTGWQLKGSNHNSKHDGAYITNCSTVHLLLQSSGTANDGNDGLSFNNFGVSDGAGLGIDDSATSVSFRDGYLGENISSTVFTKRLGRTKIDGGVFFFGYSAATYAFNLIGGLVDVTDVRFNGQTYATLSLLSQGSGGQFKLTNCQLNIPISGDNALLGDCLAYGPAFQCFAPKMGRSYTASGLATTTTVDNANERVFTVTSIGGGTTCSITAPLSGYIDHVDGTPYLVVLYKSTNVAWNIRLSGGAGGTAPTLALGSLPITAGNQYTYIKLDGALSSLAFTTIEFYTNSALVAASLSLDRVNFSDGAKMPLGNLWAC